MFLLQQNILKEKRNGQTRCGAALPLQSGNQSVPKDNMVGEGGFCYQYCFGSPRVKVQLGVWLGSA